MPTGELLGILDPLTWSTGVFPWDRIGPASIELETRVPTSFECDRVLRDREDVLGAINEECVKRRVQR